MKIIANGFDIIPLMSGHSHWSTIQRKKQAEDKKRGKLFSKLSREISLAVRSGGARLRLAVEDAKNANMPKVNIERAIKKGKGTGEKGRLEEVVYEGFGPGGVGIIVEAVTDNRQRTTAEIKKIFKKKGGSLAGPGAVCHKFKLMGSLAVEKRGDVDKMILEIMDLGVEDIEEVEDVVEIYTKPKDLEKTREKLESLGYKVKSFTLARKPLIEMPIKNRKTADQILELMSILEEHVDVQKIAANFDIDSELL